MPETKLLFTCEHASNDIPDDYRGLFPEESLAVLQSHRGWDPGTWHLGKSLAAHFDAPLFAGTFTRLLVDLNRSTWRRTLFSEFSKKLNREQRQKLLQERYFPYQNKVEQFVQSELEKERRIIHLAIHSFTPVLNGRRRNCDMGLLYDPARRNEKKFARLIKDHCPERFPDWRVRFNYPYLGKPDGLCARLRKKHPDELYLGLELELNQKYVGKAGRFPKRLEKNLTQLIGEVYRSFSWQKKEYPEAKMDKY